MRPLNIGAVLISLWSGVNLLLALGILVAMALGQNPPSVGLVFSDAEVVALDPKALALIRALAVLFNACAVSFCALVLALTWRGVVAGTRGSVAVVAVASGLLQLSGFWSDAYLGHHNLLANLVSTLILGAGLALVAFDQPTRGSARRRLAPPPASREEAGPLGQG